MSSQQAKRKLVTGYFKATAGPKTGELYRLHGTKFAIGRNPKAEIKLLSPNISRLHCTLNYLEDQKEWSITDHSSFNGTYINDVRLESEKPHILQNEANVSLGPSNLETSFVFLYLKKNPVVATKNDDVLSSSQGRRRKLSGKSIEPNPKVPKQDTSPNAEYKVKTPSLMECLQLMTSCLKENVEMEEKLDKALRETEDLLNRDWTGQRSSHTVAAATGNDSQSMLNVPSSAFLADPYPFSQVLPNTSKEQIVLKQENMRYDLPGCSKEYNSNPILDDTEKISLKEELAKLRAELEEKDKRHLELEQKILEKQQTKEEASTSEVKFETDADKSFEDRLKSEVTLQFGDVENELMCSICTELFVKATALGCAHTFCEYCIMEWKKKKKQCPICRAKIEKQTHLLCIDNLIEKMIPQLSKEYQERRAILVMERLQSTAVKPTRGKRKNTPVIQEPTPINIVVGTNEGLLSDVVNYINLSSDSDSTSTSSLEGYGYYGGYGRCFNCGRRGHWANGCPED